MFGLHIIKLTDKKKRNEGIRASHILIQDKKDSLGNVIDSMGTYNKAKEILARIKSGEDFAKVAQEVSQDPGSATKRSANEFWEETFGRYNKNEKDGEKESAGDKEKKESLKNQKRESGEEKEAVPPKKITGIGDEAFWSGNRVGGALYVLNRGKDVFIRISIGGADKEETRIDKSKKLAQMAIDRLGRPSPEH